jgi:CheY-like chemotaxis protein
VLLADDDADGALPFRRLLEEEGYKVNWLADGVAALAAASEIRPDVIILDLVLPALPGPQVLRALKADERTSTIPVVVLSAVVERLHPELSPLAAAVLEKPVDVERLLDTLTTAMRGTTTS